MKASIGTAVEILKSRYPAMFKPTSRCRPPHVHNDSLRNSLEASHVMSKFGIESASELKDWLESQNEALGELVLNGDVKISKEAWRKKAVKNSFFLGLDTRWLNSKLF